MRKFVKFACNQERLPSRCTCQDGNPHTADVHVPPYPMKIGPPDGIRGNFVLKEIKMQQKRALVNDGGTLNLGGLKSLLH